MTGRRHCWLRGRRHAWEWIAYIVWPHQVRDVCMRCGRTRERFQR